MYDIYKNCPVYKNSLITLRLLTDEDTKELLKCYSDKKAVPFFNSDNCNGSGFYNSTIEGMQQAVYFWKMSYDTKQFVRMTIIVNDTNEKIGTVEMFNRGMTEHYGMHGILRIDVQSRFETKEILLAILDIANKHFYEAFKVDYIITKTFDQASERLEALKLSGYIPMDKFEAAGYYGRFVR